MKDKIYKFSYDIFEQRFLRCYLLPDIFFKSSGDVFGSFPSKPVSQNFEVGKLVFVSCYCFCII